MTLRKLSTALVLLFSFVRSWESLTRSVDLVGRARRSIYRKFRAYQCPNADEKPFRLRFLQQFFWLSLVACPGTGYSRQEKAMSVRTLGIIQALKDTHSRCSEQVSRFSEHVDQFFSFEKPLSLCELLTSSASRQQHPGPEFTKKLVTVFHFLLLFSF